MVQYNPRAIRTVASSVILVANVLLVLAFLVGMIAAGLAAALLYEQGIVPAAFVGGIAIMALSYPLAVLLKAFAQLLLCQVQIESNTRPAGVEIDEVQEPAAQGRHPGYRELADVAYDTWLQSRGQADWVRFIQSAHVLLQGGVSPSTLRGLYVEAVGIADFDDLAGGD